MKIVFLIICCLLVFVTAAFAHKAYCTERYKKANRRDPINNYIWLSLFITIGIAVGYIYHHTLKPTLLNMQDIVANVKDGDKGDKGDKGDQGIQGEQGIQGNDGLTPYIGANGHWWIGNNDTGYTAGISSELVPNNPYYNYTHTGDCDHGGTETYVDEYGNTITYTFEAGEHLFDDVSHTCLRDDAHTMISGANNSYDMAICGTTACVWTGEDNAILTTGNGESFNTLFEVLGETVHTLIIKNGFNMIGANSFRNCEDLETVIFNDDLLYIGAHAFDGTNVTEFNLPGTIKSLGYNGRDALNPNKVESITILENKINPDDYAELDLVCYYYNDADTGEEKTLNWNYYELCNKYSNLVSFESYANVDLKLMCFRNCVSLEEVTLHKASKIRGWVFQGCISLTYLDLGEVNEIGEVAIQCCESLEEIYLPATLTTMYKWVFDGSYNLKDIYIEAEEKPEGWDVAWPGTINFCYTPKTPTAANSSRYSTGNKATIHWGVSEENPDGITTEEHI